MIAALPMYVQPENRAAHDRFWALIRDGLRGQGIAAPEALDWRIGHMESWAHPDLVLGQICNLPLRARFAGHVTLIGAPDLALPGCAAGEYYSVFVLRADDPAKTAQDCARAGYRLAYSEGLSQSGWGAAHDWAQAQGLTLCPQQATGSHAGSLRAVAEGAADWAAVDAQTWRMLTRWRGAGTGLRVVGRTHASPGLSYVTRAGQDPAPYRRALVAAIAALEEADRAALDLHGLAVLPEAAYALPLPPLPQG